MANARRVPADAGPPTSDGWHTPGVLGGLVGWVEREWAAATGGFGHRPASGPPPARPSPPAPAASLPPPASAEALRPADDDAYEAVARSLDCEVAAVKAVAAVESSGRGFRSDGRPKILFEAHVFGRLTHHVHDIAHPEISAPTWEVGKHYYSKGGRAEYDRLAAAMAVDRNAALQAASWGKFQLMGFHYAALGFATPDEFVRAMFSGEAGQLAVFARLVKQNKWDRYLRERDWAKFASRFNGSGYEKNRYDERLEQAYRRFMSDQQSRQATPKPSPSPSPPLQVPPPT